jgi:hypothetical protein
MGAAPDDSPPAGPARTGFFGRFAKQVPVEEVESAIDTTLEEERDTPDDTVVAKSKGAGFFGLFARQAREGDGVDRESDADTALVETPETPDDTVDVAPPKSSGILDRFRKAPVEESDASETSTSVIGLPVLETAAALTSTDDADVGDGGQQRNAGFLGRFKRRVPAGTDAPPPPTDTVTVPDVIDTSVTAPDEAPTPPNNVDIAEPKAEKQAGFIDRFKRQAPTKLDAPSPPPTDIVSGATAPSPTPSQLIIGKSASPPYVEALSKLSSENERLRRRCDELSMQSQLNQEMLQDCVTTAKLDVDDLTIANKKLSKQCEELDMKVSMNHEDLVRCTDALARKVSETKSLELTIRALKTRPIMSVSVENETIALKATVKKLSADLTALDERYMRLRAMGCAPSDEIDMHKHIAVLESENRMLQDKLAKRTADTKARVLDYATELNDLSTQLRNAETDAKTYHAQLALQRSTFLTLKAEFDGVTVALDAERTANTALAAPRSDTPQQGRALRDVEHENNVLATQLARMQATAEQREALLATFQEQQKTLVKAVQADGKERKQLQSQIKSLYAENEGDRKRFEDKLKRRDGRISALEKRLRDAAGRRGDDEGERADAASETKATKDQVKALQGRLDQADLQFEDEFARRVAGMQFEADEGARERIRELEVEVRDMGRKRVKKTDSGFTERGD